MVFNGEVYNFRELRSRFDYPYQSHTDSEVVLAAWSKMGRKCVELFNGMFAIAVWDKKEQTLSLVRDRMGIKPVYWSHNERGFCFSSEVRALLASGLVSKKLKRDSVVDFLRYQTVQTPDTIKAQKKSSDSYEEVKKQVRRLFMESVERRLVADVPFGAFLSGGIDSSAVVGAMTKVSNNRIDTFNITFWEDEFSEAPYARYIAKMHNTNHHEIHLKPDDFLHFLPDALSAMDHPSGDGPNTWVVSKMTKEAGITMALSGLGGDEVFGGYAIFNRMMALEKKKWLWK
jgi:asparagine synthase (glutamine-hydrolysing)